MRLKPGRPDLAAYSHLFTVPTATGELSATFLGVSTILLDDGETAILTDGFFSRPGLLDVAIGKVSPNLGRIDAALSKALRTATRTATSRKPGRQQLAAVVPVHSHFDHALDSAVVAHRTGAQLIGGASTLQIGLGGRLPRDRITLAVPGEPITLGDWTLTLIESDHCPPDRYPGEITRPVVPPARASAYRCGEAWSILVAHARGSTTLIQGSAGFVAGSLTGHRAEVAYLGIGQLGLQDPEYITTYWTETVRTVGARRVVLTHWDDFFKPLPLHPGDPGLRALPYAGDDLDVTMQVLTALAAEDGTELCFPTLWQREDPWFTAP